MPYELRLIFSKSEKETFTKTEIVERLDQIAITKSDRCRHSEPA